MAAPTAGYSASNSSSAASGPASNKSINVNGSGGGTVADLAQLLQVVNGPSYNGGFTDAFVDNPGYSGLSRPSELSAYLPYILIGGALLLAVVLIT